MTLDELTDDTINRIINEVLAQQELFDSLDIDVQMIKDEEGRYGFSFTDQYGSSIDYLFNKNKSDEWLLLGIAGLSGALQGLINKKIAEMTPNDQ